MNKWYVENYIGMDPCFLKRNIIKSPRCIQQCIIEPECSSFRIKQILGAKGKVFIRAYVENKMTRIPVDLSDNREIIAFSCFDRLKIFIFVHSNNRVRLFQTSLCCCRSWNVESIKAYEIGLFSMPHFIQIGNEFLEIKISVKNLREDGYHYNLCEIEDLVKYYGVTWDKQRFLVKKYQCIFCFKYYNNITEILEHINTVHMYYKGELEDNMISIKNIEQKKLGFEKESNKSEQEIRKIENQFEFSFFKKRNGKIINYKFDKYYIQIEKEYDLIDYSGMLGDYLNSRELSLCNNNSKKLDIMKAWNRIRVSNHSMMETLNILIEMYSCSEEVLDMINTFYIKGLITSKDILELIEKHLYKS